MTYQEWKNAHAFRLPASAIETLDRIMVGQPDQIAAAVLREREECAKVCDAHYNHEAKDCAEEIRNRGTK